MMKIATPDISMSARFLVFMQISQSISILLVVAIDRMDEDRSRQQICSDYPINF